MKKLFFAYHPLDASLALRLVAGLRNAGVGVVHTPREQAAANCEMMVVILTPYYVERFQSELGTVAARNCPIIAVVLQDIEDWPTVIRRDWALDVRQMDSVQVLTETLVKQLRSRKLVDSPPDTVTQYINCQRTSVPFYVPLKAYTRRLTLNVGFDPEAEASELRVVDIPDAREAVAIFPACIVVGAPGGGKTTTLQQVFESAAQRYLENPAEEPLPLYIDLAAWPDGTRLSKYLATQMPEQSNQVALIMDNLELIGPRNANALRDWLKRGDLPARLVVACRAAAYNGGLGLPLIQLDVLDADRIRQMIEAYLGQDKVSGFLDIILPDSESIPKPLVTIPYLLVAMMRVYAVRGEIPDSAGMLLQHNVHILSGAAFEELQDNLAKLAAAMLDDEEYGYVDLKWARVQMGGSRWRWGRGAVDEKKLVLLRRAELVGLVEIQDDTLRFSHQLLQSYFAAVALMQDGVSNSIAAPSFDNREFKRIPGKWDQAVKLLCGLVTDPEVVVAEVLEKDPYLAAECVINGVEVSEKVSEQVRDVLIAELDKNDWRETAAAIEALRHLDEASLVQLLIEDYMVYGNLYERRVATLALGDIGHPAGIPMLVEALQDDSVRELAGQALVKIGEAAIDEVVGALDQERWETRDAAAQVLRQIGTDETIPIMLKTLYDPAYEVRWSMATALTARGEAAVPGLVDVLNDGAALEPDDGICRVAASTLARIDSEAAVNGLIDALQDADPRRRAAVAEAMAESSQPQAVTALIGALDDAVHWDDEETVADVAAFSLERIGTPEAIDALFKWRKANHER